MARKGFVGNHNAEPTACVSTIATVTQKYL